jgi:hypothetical protein
MWRVLNTFVAVAGVLSSCAESPPPPEPEAGSTEVAKHRRDAKGQILGHRARLP